VTQHGKRSPGESEDLTAEELERVLLGTPQHLTAILDSDNWGSRQGKAGLLADVRQRMDATSRLIERWLKANRS
jgi:hypothetical protein